jgi:HEAT repeat protein
MSAFMGQAINSVPISGFLRRVSLAPTAFSSKLTNIFVCQAMLLVFLVSLKLQAFSDFPPNCSTDIRAEATQPAGGPILLTIILTNKGENPFAYPPPYPNADWFTVQVSKGPRKIHEIRPSNQWWGGTSGAMRNVEPGKSVEVPAAIDPLPPGTYKLQIGNGKSTEVTVKEESKLLRAREEDLHAKILKGDVFVDHVAAKYPSKPLLTLLLKELVSDDDLVVDRAASPLLRVPKLPEVSAALVSKAVDKRLNAVDEYLAPARQAKYFTAPIFQTLANLNAKVGSDEALESVLKIARTHRVRGNAILALGKFKQQKATDELYRFLIDENGELQFEAARTLSASKDPAALPILLKVAGNSESRWRMYAIGALVKYPDDPNVELVIRSALDDPRSSVRQSAEFALRQLASQKKQKP